MFLFLSISLSPKSISNYMRREGERKERVKRKEGTLHKDSFLFCLTSSLLKTGQGIIMKG